MEEGNDKGGGLGVQRKIGIVVGGAGLAALGVATVFAAKAAGAKSDSEAHCVGNTCDDEGIRIRESGMTSGNIATGLFIGGSAAAAGGLILLLTAPSSQKGSSSGAKPSVTQVSLGPAGASVSGVF
jgi:hypothetical protein